jgi:hypothetical protein
MCSFGDKSNNKNASKWPLDIATFESFFSILSISNYPKQVHRAKQNEDEILGVLDGYEILKIRKLLQKMRLT